MTHVGPNTPDTAPARWRWRPGVPVAATVGAAALLGLAVIVPLGLASGEAVDLVARARGVRGPFSEAAPLAELASSWAALLPAGEAGVRGHAVAALISALGLALWAARLRGLLSPKTRSPPGPAATPLAPKGRGAGGAVRGI
jgi:hypothetical protein